MGIGKSTKNTNRGATGSRLPAKPSSQLGLFDVAASVTLEPRTPVTRAPVTRAPAPQSKARMVEERDLPPYPRELVDQVDRSIAELSPSRVWMTYRDIRACFGISRATVARRLKEGVIPGVRMLDGHVLDDGGVRRFDRTQLRWLLLAVRYRGANVERQ